jgi:septal ring factor EnvC (AmiA/AmiB activator)
LQEEIQQMKLRQHQLETDVKSIKLDVVETKAEIIKTHTSIVEIQGESVSNGKKLDFIADWIYRQENPLPTNHHHTAGMEKENQLKKRVATNNDNVKSNPTYDSNMDPGDNLTICDQRSERTPLNHL